MKTRRGVIAGDAEKEEAQFNSKLAYVEPILESGLQVIFWSEFENNKTELPFFRGKTSLNDSLKSCTSGFKV